MAGDDPTASGRIFISYRREETAYPAGWLDARLVEHFGREQIFKDIDSIELGDEFPRVIAEAVGSCDVLPALIGERWLTVADPHGRRRLDNPDDFVRLEIEAALQRDVRVIPILVDGRPCRTPASCRRACPGSCTVTRWSSARPASSSTHQPAPAGAGSNARGEAERGAGRKRAPFDT